MSAMIQRRSGLVVAAALFGWALTGGGTAAASETTHPVVVDLSSLVAAHAGDDRRHEPSDPEGIPAATNLLTGVHFDSIDSNECCGAVTVVPSDPDIAAGPGHLIVAVNVALEIYDTSGTSLVGPLTLATFFAPLGGDCAGSPFFPTALFDESAGRFIVAADGNGTTLCLAVSLNDNPTGAWTLWGIQANTGGGFLDWPTLGVGRDAIFVGATMASATSIGRVWAIDKSQLYSSSAISPVYRDLGAAIRPAPLHLHGAADGTWPQSGPHHFLTLTDPPDPAAFALHAWSDPFGANTFTTIGTLDVASVHGIPVADPVPFPQLGGSPIAATPSLFKDFEYRNGFGWTANHVACNPGSGVVDCIQWAQINLSNATVAQAGILTEDGVYRTYPDLAVNACNDMAVGYTRSGASIFPGIGAAGRQALDPPGTLQDELIAKNGETTYTYFSDRWGEYTGMTIDPTGSIFWYAGIYSKNNGNTAANWGTYVSSFTFSNCGAIFADGFESGNTFEWSASVP